MPMKRVVKPVVVAVMCAGVAVVTMSGSAAQASASQSIASASWYYVDAQGATKGPLAVEQLRDLYIAGDVTPDTYVWNGGSVNQWTELSNVAALWQLFTADVQPIAGDSPYEGGYLYYVDAGGNTQGPVTFGLMRGLYAAGWVTAATYVWDGAAINTWTPLSDLSSILAALQKVPPQPKKKKRAKKKVSKKKASKKRSGKTAARVPPKAPKRRAAKKRSARPLPPVPKRPVPKAVTKR